MAWGIGAGIGVAGNFAGHLEQAREASDFRNVQAEQGAPKGIFPFWMPGLPGSFLSTDPLSDHVLRLPNLTETAQIEPEVAVVCELDWLGDEIDSITPRFAAAFDDCSLRREGAPKISVKKNWGPGSKGMAAKWITLDGFGKGHCLDSYRLACFLHRDNELIAYGIDSPVAGYSYFHHKLMDWITAKLATQRDQGPLEDIGGMLRAIGKPQKIVITIGATLYTEFGESGWLRPGDRTVVCLYRPEDGTATELVTKALAGQETPASILIREVKL
jgi:Family of unknown function (DUF5718)